MRFLLVVLAILASASSSAALVVGSNTSNVPLADGDAYIGQWQTTSTHSSITVKVVASHSGILQIDFSDDCQAETNDLDYVISANIPDVHRLVITSQCFRVYMLNNSGSLQTSLNVETTLSEAGLLTAPYNLNLQPDSDALPTRPSSFQDEIVLGRRSGISSWNKFAYRTDTTAASGQQTIWATSTNFTPMTTGDTFTVVYNATTDGLGTTGAITLAIYYLNTSNELAVATHTLGSDGSDVTSFSGLGINRVAVASSGSADKNTNNITITDTSAVAGTQAVVPALGSVTQQAIFHMPSNAKGVAEFLWINANKTGGASPKVLFVGYVYNRLVDTRYEIFRYNIDTSVDNKMSMNDSVGFALSSSDILYFEMDTDTNSTVANIRFSLNVYNNE